MIDNNCLCKAVIVNSNRNLDTNNKSSYTYFVINSYIYESVVLRN